MNLKSKITLSIKLLCLLCIGMWSNALFAQKIDSGKISIKPKSKIISRVPQIKANIQTYQPQLNYNATTNVAAANKNGKTLTILKVYPNPVNDQININLRLDKETLLSIKITDLLGNDVIGLLNERTSAGEQTKTFTIPSKLSAGIYFLRIVAGGEPIVKRISVL